MRWTRTVTWDLRLGGFATVLGLLAPRPAAAIFHLSVINQVATSVAGDATQQFIEIRSLAAGHWKRSWPAKRVDATSARGALIDWAGP